MKQIYENQHFIIYKQNEDLYLVSPKDKYPKFWTDKKEVQKLIKEYNVE